MSHNLVCPSYKDTFNQVKRICEFLGKKFNDDQINSLIKSTSFDEMAANPNATHVQWLNNHFANPEKFQFMRKGKFQMIMFGNVWKCGCQFGAQRNTIVPSTQSI